MDELGKFSPEIKHILARGIKASWPICLGYIPIGLAFGVLAQKAGLSPLEIGLMSLFVFAGSSQFIAVSMMGSGAGFLAIVLTTFSVNLRHLLMSSSLARYLGHPGRRWVSLFAYGVTDESFAVNLTKFLEGDWHWREALVLNHTANLAWIGSTVLGGVGGRFIPEGAFGIDYALTAMFLCLLVFQLRGKLFVLTAILSGVFSVVLALRIPGNSHIVIASMLSAALGVLLKRGHLRIRKSQSKAGAASVSNCTHSERDRYEK
ncbi:MAG: AzlC family ABC transporter permease [Deltaproteobacteria bacterium]|nr:AzlC family ABC transporter permease [Deltaproteobacteria bacterium]MBW2018368.1 AzlC family ABC transporter permease [Deltaproteobacteria bacterium]MBW2130505.1 AzlC family ABC transporter permease [Deltaproteobacteria bacterium]MBW2303687.1 AzlC family ABC transporter permease [Deltaproteobacteria bacterium]